MEKIKVGLVRAEIEKWHGKSAAFEFHRLMKKEVMGPVLLSSQPRNMVERNKIQAISYIEKLKNKSVSHKF
jgi:hypothetical protein